jgi:hypothetical protein
MVENVLYCKSGYLMMPSVSTENIWDRMIDECAAVGRLRIGRGNKYMEKIHLGE